MTYSTVYSHPVLGELTVASDGANVTGLWLAGQKYFGNGATMPFERADDLPALVQAREWLDRYFADDPLPAGALPLAPHGTGFQLRVWHALAGIPYGQLRTYGDIAAQVGCGSARAVGGAVGHNPISIIVPCHRVVGASGSLTGYAGGVRRKLWLLEHEHVDTNGLRVPTRGTAL